MGLHAKKPEKPTDRLPDPGEKEATRASSMRPARPGVGGAGANSTGQTGWSG